MMDGRIDAAPAATATPPGWARSGSDWWHGLAGRERRAVGLAGLALAAVLLWLLALAPALRTLGSVPAAIDTADAQLQTMQRLAAEAGVLRATAAVSSEQAGAALKSATERLGDKARLTIQGDRAVLTLTGVGTAALRDWLAEARAGARARPVEASLTRGEGGLSGSLVLVLAGGGTL